MIVADKMEVWSFLDDLRDSDKTNMFVATSYIVKEFDMDESTARELLVSWLISTPVSKQDSYRDYKIAHYHNQDEVEKI